MKKDNCKIYIIQMHTYTIPSRLIKRITNYEYSHIAISLDRNCNTIYSFGRKKYTSFINGGFSVEHKSGEFFSKFKDTICRIYELDVTIEQYNALKKIINYMKNNKEIYKYDYIGVFLRYIKVPVRFKDKYVCSFFVADILEKANIYKFDKKTCFIKPKDFENIPNLNLIYVGNYLKCV